MIGTMPGPVAERARHARGGVGAERAGDGAGRAELEADEPRRDDRLDPAAGEGQFGRALAEHRVAEAVDAVADNGGAGPDGGEVEVAAEHWDDQGRSGLDVADVVGLAGGGGRPAAGPRRRHRRRAGRRRAAARNRPARRRRGRGRAGGRRRRFSGPRCDRRSRAASDAGASLRSLPSDDEPSQTEAVTAGTSGLGVGSRPSIASMGWTPAMGSLLIGQPKANAPTRRSRPSSPRR